MPLGPGTTLGSYAVTTRLLPKPAVASAMVKVPERTAKAAAANATAPIGMGRSMIPTIVATKTASRCHARGSTPDGTGTSQSAAPTRIAAARRPTATLAAGRRSAVSFGADSTDW